MKPKINILKVILGASLVFMASACTPEQSTRKRSFSDDQVEVSRGRRDKVSTSSEAQRLEKMMVEMEALVTSQMSEGSIDANLLLTKVINPLREVILNVDYLLDPKNRHVRTESGRYIIPRLVSLFNESILLVNKTNAVMIESDLLTKYKDMLLWDCDSQLRGSCEFIKFFRSNDTVNTTVVIKLIHDQLENEDEKLRLIRAGFDLKNRRLDSALRFMLLERIASSLEKEKIGELSPQRRAQDADLFANMLKVSVKELSGKDKYVALVKSLNPWKLSRNVDSGKNPAMTDIIRLASEQMLYDNGKLNEVIKKEIIPEMLYVVGPNYEQGVKFQEDNILGKWKKPYEEYKEDKAMASVKLTDIEKMVFSSIDSSLDVELYNDTSKKILKNLLSDVSYDESSLDEYFYLAHQAFYGHFNIDDATAFWSHSKKDTSRLLDEIDKLIKIQMVNNIVLTNTRMNEFYNRNENSKLIELLRESDKEASKIRKAWSTSIVRAKFVKSFITRVVNRGSLDTDARKKYDRINSSVDALTKNIKFLVTYPNMFPLMHVMASLEMKDTIRGFFGTFTIDSLTIIDWFFAGRFPPWFNFGNDGASLDTTEIIYTYYYALVTQIFETYSTNTVVNFSHEDFFKVVVKKLILDEETALDTDRRYLVQKTEDFKNNALALARVCSEEERLQGQEHKELDELKAKHGDGFSWYQAMRWKNVMRPRSRVKNQVAFVDLGSNLYDGTSNRADKMGKYINDIYSSKVRGTFENMRQSFPTKNVMAQTLVDVFKSTNGGDPEEIDKLVKEQYEEYNRLKAEFVRTYTQAESQIRGCDWAFLNRDRDIRHMMIFREAEELGKLFDKVWPELQALSDDEKNEVTAGSPVAQKLEEIRKTFGVVNGVNVTQDVAYPEDYRKRFGYNRLSTTRLTSFGMDTQARVYAYIGELFPGEYAITMPPDFTDTSTYIESSPDIIYFDWSIEDKEQAKRAFVKSGIKAFANQMGWAGESPPIGSIAEKGEILVNLFKLGELSTDPEVDCSKKDLSEEVKKNACFKVEAKDVIEHFKRALDYLNIDERDEEILSLIGKEYKYVESIYEGYIKKKNEHRLYSYYDLIFKRILSDERVSDGESAWFTGNLISYVNSVHKIEGSTFLFPYSPEINEIFVSKYSEWINSYYDRNNEFLKEVKNQLGEGVEPFRFKYRTDRSDTVGGTSFLGDVNDKVSLEPLVSDLWFGKFEGLTQQLNNDTSGYFSKIIFSHKSKIKELVAPQEAN